AADTTLAVTGTTTLDNDITLAGPATINAIDNTVHLYLTGLLSGPGDLTTTGDGYLYLYNDGTSAAHSGGLIITTGFVLVEIDNDLPAGTITLNGGTLAKINAPAANFDNDILVTANGGRIGITSQDLTLSGTISGPGTLVIQGDS